MLNDLFIMIMAIVCFTLVICWDNENFKEKEFFKSFINNSLEEKEDKK